MREVIDERLLTAASFVRLGSRAADIGADHAYLCIHLIRHGICSEVIATDIRPGPIAIARGNITAAGLDSVISVRNGDGLAPIADGEVDDIIIAGMGGETIADIVEAAPWTKNGGMRLILQPMSKPEELRRRMYLAGFAPVAERAARAGGRLYTVMAMEYDPLAAAALSERPAVWYYGLLDPQHLESRQFLEHQRNRLLRAAAAGRNGLREMADSIEKRLNP